MASCYNSAGFNIETIHEQHQQQTTLPHGLNSLIDLVNDSSRIPEEYTKKLFDTIASSIDSPENTSLFDFVNGLLPGVAANTDENRHTLAWSFMPLVVKLSFGIHHTKGATPLDDYIQSGVEGLYRAVNDFADQSDRSGSFASFAMYYVQNAQRAQRHQDIFHTNVEKTLLNGLYICRAAQQEKGGSLSRAELISAAKKGMISLNTARGALRLMEVSERGNVYVAADDPVFRDMAWEVRDESEKELSPKLQMALLLLSPNRYKTIEQFYGLDPESPSLGLDEIADLQGVSIGTVRKHRDAALIELRTLINLLDKHGTDFDQWPEAERYFRKNLNILTYLHRAKLPIPMNKNVAELGVQAMQDLSARDIPDKYKQIVADMYGLHAKPGLKNPQLIKKYGLSTGRYSQIAKVALSAAYAGATA